LSACLPDDESSVWVHIIQDGSAWRSFSIAIHIDLQGIAGSGPDQMMPGIVVIAVVL